MNSPDVLLHEVASYSLNCRINLCHCLFLLTGSYLVADAIAYLSSPQCLNVVPSVSTYQCQVDTAPSQINALVPRATDSPLLVRIDQHPRNKCFVRCECLIRCDIYSTRITPVYQLSCQNFGCHSCLDYSNQGLYAYNILISFHA